MGYRSDIYIKAKHEAFPQISAVLDEELDIASTEYKEDDEYFYITLEQYKWYDSYAWVQKINHVIYELGEQNLVTMVRIGEEPDDIETYGAEPHELNMYYHTIVKFDGYDEDATTPTKLKESYPEYFI